MIYKNIILTIALLAFLNATAQVGVKTSTPENRSLDIDGNLRVAEIPSSLVTKTYTYLNSSNKIEILTEKVVDKNKVDRVLVANEDGKVEHINLTDFYAFNFHQARYVTRTASYTLDEPVDRKIVDGTVVRADWIDLAVQYINQTGRYLEVKFRPNYILQKQDGTYHNFIVTTVASMSTGAEIAYFTKFINPNIETSTESMDRWFYASRTTASAIASKAYTRLNRDFGFGEAVKYIQFTFFCPDISKTLIVEVYFSIHKKEDGSFFLNTTYWIVQPEIM